MIDRLELFLRKTRRFFSASEWGVSLLGRQARSEHAASRGLVLIQVDGLSEPEFERALVGGTMPFLRRLRNEEGYQSLPFYCGVPSTTPAVQGELFYGVRAAVPAFSFVDRRSGRVVKMYEHDPARDIEQTFPVDSPLLDGGSAYCDIYTGGATDARFCMSSMGWGDLVRTSDPWKLPVVALLHLPSLLWTSILVGSEVVRATGGFVQAVTSGESWRAELRFIPTRVAICVLLREMVTLGAQLDIARGSPIVHLNMVGYDEHAHRRGPAARLAQRELRSIDACIARLTRSARRSVRRSYDVWVYSDHGQEATVSYLEQNGRTVQEAVAEVVRRHLDTPSGPSEPRHGVRGQRARMLLGEKLLRWLIPGADVGAQWTEPGLVTVTAIGPLGHVYLPGGLTPECRSRIGRELASDAAVPLVLASDGPDSARAWIGNEELTLPNDAARILGPEHPYLEAAAHDLVTLCAHSMAGDFVLSGWQRDETPVSFPLEKGAHGGPGGGETSAFVFAPGDTDFPGRRERPMRPGDLRQVALGVLGRAETPRKKRREASHDRPLRIMTYNVHSCIGMDGVVSPERIARVIARHDPDIVALQELDVGRPRTGGVDQAHAIAQQLEMLFRFHATVAVEEERFGDAILSAHPLEVLQAGPLPGLAARPDLEPRGAIWATVQIGGFLYHVVNTHLSLNARERSLQVDALLGPEWLSHPACAPRRILCGDFNALPFFPICRRITRQLRDCQTGHASHRPRSTFFGRLPLGRIDHIFVEPALRVLGFEVPSDSLARVASDHLPLITRIETPR